MNLELAKLAAAGNTWGAIAPELMLGCLALALLGFEIVLPKKYHGHIPDFALIGIFGVLAGLLINFNSATLGP